MPVRKIPRGRRALTGIHADGGKRGIAFESSIERDLVTLMLFDPDVIEVEEQPVAIRFTGEDGKSHTYHPDFLVTRRAGKPRLIEVKPAEELRANGQVYAERFAAARIYADHQGWRFEVWTDKDIRTVRLENARFLLPYKSRTPDSSMVARLLGALRGRSPVKAAALIDETYDDLNERMRAIATIWHLVATGQVSTDLDRRLTQISEIALARRR